MGPADPAVELPMRRKLVWVLSVVVLTTVATVYRASLPRLTATEFRNQLERDIPAGTPRTEAAAWLRSQGYIDNDFTPGCCSMGDSCHTREFSVSRWPAVFPKRLRFEVAFDEQGRRTDHVDVAEVKAP